MPAPLLLLLPGLPLLAAVVLALAGPRLGRRAGGSVATLSVAAAFLVALGFLPGDGARLDLGTWFAAGGFEARFAFRLDPLALAMSLLVTGVGTLVHAYSIGYLDAPEDRGRTSRYFALLALFVALMEVLVLADDLVLLFLGWEGVGLASWLLIGFWYERDAFADAGRKAFVVNRVGDFAFLLGLFWLVGAVGPEVGLRVTALEAALAAHPLATGTATAVALLLFCGAMGKSAQLPLATWLPDAMAGPTPVSALIHAATMVTAGVYLLGRLHFLYDLAPLATAVVALVGLVTATWAALAAAAQTDLKKVLAWSTISQLGYLFLALGAGATGAAFFHLFTHGAFKALLFLAAGSVIHALHHRQDLREMGGLRRTMGLTFAAAAAGWAAIVGVPGTAGFFSKDALLWGVWHGDPARLLGPPALYAAVGVAVAGLTAFYMSRMLFLAFFGAYRGSGGLPPESRPVLTVPLGVLAVLALGGGVLDLPGDGVLSRFLAPVLGPAAGHGAGAWLMSLVIVLISGAGVALAAVRYLRPAPEVRRGGAALEGFYVDALVGRLAGGSAAAARWADRRLEPLVLGGVDGVGRALRGLADAYGRHVQHGRIQGYALAVALGAAALLVAWAVA